LKKYLLQFIEIIDNTEYPQNIYLLIYKNAYIIKKIIKFKLIYLFDLVI